MAFREFTARHREASLQTKAYSLDPRPQLFSPKIYIALFSNIGTLSHSARTSFEHGSHLQKGFTMTKRSLQHLLKLGVVTSAALLALSARADLRGHADDDRRGSADHDRRTIDGSGQDDDDDRRGHRGLLRLATGQFITPTFIDGAVQQYLNPGLPAYPNFVAGEAVRSQLSPDGTTLAIITAGQNSLYKPDGTVDVANSTQYIFLYNVAGANKARPVLTQVIKQVNAHVGLVFSPDGNTLYAAGGNDDAVYVYTKSGGSFAAAAPIALGHFAARRHRQRPQQGRRPQRAAQRQRHGHLRRRPHAGRRQQLQRLDQRHRHRDAHRSLRARSAPVLREQRGHERRRRRHLPVRASS